MRADLVLHKDAGVYKVVDLVIGSLCSKSDKLDVPKTAQLEKIKTKEYRHFELDSKFVAFAGDSYGAIGEQGKAMIEEIIPGGAPGEKCPRREVYWRYSLALARGNSDMISEYIRVCYHIFKYGKVKESESGKGTVIAA